MPQLLIRNGLTLGNMDYARVWNAMRDYTDSRGTDGCDELWWLEHAPVFTLGQAGRQEHVLAPANIPLVQSDRGGQVTYHGPGQLVGYLLFDLRRLGVGVRDLVSGIENAIIALLADHGVTAVARRDAPGVYVEGAKVAALGLRIRKGCSYHGLSLNVDMDLEPFARINPCGYANLPITNTKLLGIDADCSALAAQLSYHLAQSFGFEQSQTAPWQLTGTGAP